MSKKHPTIPLVLRVRCGTFVIVKAEARWALYVLRLVGTLRLLAENPQNIDIYTSAGSRISYQKLKQYVYIDCLLSSMSKRKNKKEVEVWLRIPKQEGSLWLKIKYGHVTISNSTLPRTSTCKNKP